MPIVRYIPIFRVAAKHIVIGQQAINGEEMSE
jgi:hypothetical protein